MDEGAFRVAAATDAGAAWAWCDWLEEAGRVEAAELRQSLAEGERGFSDGYGAGAGYGAGDGYGYGAGDGYGYGDDESSEGT